MFLTGVRKRKTGQRTYQSTARRFRPLHCELLESKRVLAGIVWASFDPANGNVLLEGDLSANNVHMYQLSPGVFQVDGLDGTLIVKGEKPHAPPFIPDSPQPSQVLGPFANGDITVDLGHGDDTFTFGDEAGDLSFAMHDLVIINDWGSNNNEVVNAKVMRDLKVEKMGSWSFSGLKLKDVEVQRDTIIMNGVSEKMPYSMPMNERDREKKSGGDTSTEIISSDLQGTFTLQNGDGNDITNIQDTLFGRNDMGDATIHNGNGGSRVTMTDTDAEFENKFFGNLTIINKDNLIGALVFDTVTFNRTEVAKKVFIDNGFGDTMVLIQDGSVLGSEMRVPSNSKMEWYQVEVINHEGIDKFEMLDSSAPWGLEINHGSGRSEENRQFYGSSTQIERSEIATHPKTDHGLKIDGDDKKDLINIIDTWIGGPFGIDIQTFHGDDMVTLFLKDHPVSMIWIQTDEGNDMVLFNEVLVEVNTMVGLGEGIDSLELRTMTQLLTESTLDGGDGDQDLFAEDADTVRENSDVENFEV